MDILYVSDDNYTENTYSEEVHIVYASDDAFSEILGISLISLFEKSKDTEKILLYIFDNNICEKNKKRIEYICKQYGRELPHWIYAQNICEKISLEVVTDRGSLSQYSRLFIASSLPSDVERVLYLDCDIIFNHSVSELWKLNIQGKTVAAALDAFSKYYRRNLGLEPNDVIFNSGVMLIDLVKWREKQIETKLLQYLCSKNGKVQQGDQGVLNAVLSKDTYCFEPHYNAVTYYFDFTYQEMLTYRKPPEFYRYEQVQRAVDNPTIIHFTTSFLSSRPWINGCQHRYVDVWKKYKMMSPWAESRLWENNKKGYLYLLIRIMPKKLMVCLVGFLHAYLRPITYSLK